MTKRTNQVVRIRVVIFILATVFIKITKSINREIIELVSINNMYIPKGTDYAVDSDCATIESEELKIEKYESSADRHVFIKNLESDEKDLQNTRNVLVSRNKEILDIVQYKGKVLVCPYSEISEKDMPRKKIKYSLPQGRDIWINMHQVAYQDIFLNQLKIAAEYSKKPEELLKIWNAFFYIKKLVNVLVCIGCIDDFLIGKEYIKSANITAKDLEEIGLKDSLACKLISEPMILKYAIPSKEIFEAIRSILPNMILERNKHKNIGKADICSERDRFEKQEKRILEHIRSRQRMDKSLGIEETKNKEKENTLVLIQMLDNRNMTKERISIEEIKKTIEPWNEKLVRLIEKRLQYIRDCHSIGNLRDKIKKNDRNIIWVVEIERRREFNECIYVNRVKGIYEYIHEFNNKPWHRKDGGSRIDENRGYSKEEIKEENIKIIELLLGSAVKYECLSSFDQYDSISLKMKEIISIMEGVDKLVAERNRKEDASGVKDRIIQEKKRIVQIIFNTDIENENYAGADSIKTITQEIIEIIVGFALNRQIKNSTYKNFSEVLMQNNEKIEEIITFNYGSILKDIIELAENFHYKRNRHSPDHQKVTFGYDRLFSFIKKFNRDNLSYSWIFHQPIDYNLKDIYKLCDFLLTFCKQINRINSNGEIWKTPAVLIYPSSAQTPNSSIKTAAIQFYQEERKEFYTREIEFTDANLKAFREARTLDDIKSI